MAIDKDTAANAATNAAKTSKAIFNTGKSVVESAVESIKAFFNELVRPNMTIEKIAEVASPRLDDLIRKNEAQGMKFSAGKFKVEYLDEDHFGMAFEMYFKDEAGKWYKTNGASDPRDVSLLDLGSWKTLQTLKAVEFPISTPKDESATPNEVDNDASSSIDQSGDQSLIDAPQINAPAAKPEIDLESLLAAKGASHSGLSLDKK